MYIAIILLGLITIPDFINRAIGSLKNIPYATANNYQQQYQMGSFLARFYQGKAIAANDIGAINYLADIKTVDLDELSNFQVAKMKKMRNYST